MKKKASPNQKMLFWWGWILIVWSIYRSVFKTALPIWFDEFIAKPVVFILPVLLYIKKIEKKSIIDRLDFRSKNIMLDLSLGLVFGLVLFVIATSFTELNLNKNIPFIFLIAIATSVSEEILSRGFVLKRLYETWGSIFNSAFFASILYFFLRVPILFTNERITGSALLIVMFVDIVFSLFVSLVFLLRRNLVAPIFIHAFYSIYIYLLFS